MFSKANSRFLITANVLLLGQIVVGVIYFLLALSRVIFPAGEVTVGSMELVRAMVIVAIGGLMMLLVNKWRRKTFQPGLVRAEKVFNLVTLAVLDASTCVTLSYLLVMPFGATDLAARSMRMATGSAGAVALVFLLMFVIVPKLKVFRNSFSGVLNYILMLALIGMGWSAAWLAGTRLAGPDGSSDITQAVFSQQIFRLLFTTVFLAGMVVVLVKNGRRLSGEKAALRIAENRGWKLLGAELSQENQKLKAEIERLEKTVQKLEKKNEKKNKKEPEKEEAKPKDKKESSEKVL